MTDCRAETFIINRIPHRPPFLWLDRVLEASSESLVAEKDIPVDLELFQGHYPGYPLMPGVLLCEAVFQAGAVLLAGQLEEGDGRGRPVLTRIVGAKFKREVRPGDTIRIQVRLTERIGPAWFMKGSVRVRDLLAVQVEFACTITEGQRS
ncbi:MAG TPA: beta-hydroxyacyl-ACP dehydratase [Desulfobulbaceae bacterium]|nr:beta-hydroxyacyl-ACP dehydratase [Desulfobulbaceae bacterium]